VRAPPDSGGGRVTPPGDPGLDTYRSAATLAESRSSIVTDQADAGRYLRTQVVGRVVRMAEVEDLGEAIAGRPCLLVEHGFICPRCGGTAAAQGDLRWRCYDCPATGTTWQLQRLVLENPAALGRLLELLAARAVANA
jgi:ribosomal protein S27AE